mmetsp:Transcript_1308/g.2860  ORF Transcript_1308/g.2860 Transcript_1308/m.2860 type:complete len:209 (+) Transcript_1308:202-828(+)
MAKLCVTSVDPPQLTTVARPDAMPRASTGKSSPTMSHGTGPHPNANDEMKSASPAAASIGPAPASAPTNPAVATVPCNQKYVARRPSPADMPTPDAASSVLRPSLSTSVAARPVHTTCARAMYTAAWLATAPKPARERIPPEKKMTALIPENCCIAIRHTAIDTPRPISPLVSDDSDTEDPLAASAPSEGVLRDDASSRASFSDALSF